MTEGVLRVWPNRCKNKFKSKYQDSNHIGKKMKNRNENITKEEIKQAVKTTRNWKYNKRDDITKEKKRNKHYMAKDNIPMGMENRMDSNRMEKIYQWVYTLKRKKKHIAIIIEGNMFIIGCK